MENKRNDYLDLLKFFLIVLIIITHSNLALSHREGNFLFPFIIDMSVPCFLVISGYVNSISFSKTSNQNSWFYERKSLVRKTCRIIIPFVPLTFIVIFCWVFLDRISLLNLLFNIVFQRWGQGGYYPIIMLQFIVLFPLLARITEKPLGCVALLLLNLLSEICFSFLSEMTYGSIFTCFHRICILRYLSFIVAGILLYRNRQSVSLKSTMLTGLFGLVLVYCVNYITVFDHIFKLWQTTSLPVVLWACFPVMTMLLLERKEKKNNNLIFKCCTSLGKASYHIFLIQMIWYFLSAKEGLFQEPPLLFSIAACLLIGFLFYQMDLLVQKTIIGKLNHV